jgi:2-oxoglutarate dehydrogenase E1 component
VIDQFICAGESKWSRLSGLVMFLPHGYDGQGPEHSSARIERYLQLCAEENMQVCVPSLPAQMFHLLRRQMQRPYRKPLIVMTPKSLLRHRDSTSSVNNLSQDFFHNVIDEPADILGEAIRRVVFCSGKVYFDLSQERSKRGTPIDTALIRIEQLYPFPADAIRAVMVRYPQANSIVWCQEEPRNQGAWEFMKDFLQHALGPKFELRYAGRPAAAAPAVGYLKKHIEQQRQLVEDAFS